MSIKHVLLALLAEEPIHGYELKKRYDETLGALWPVQQAQIYNNLRLLEKDGLVELEARIEQENLPDRKHFRLTEAGRHELTHWTHTPVPSSRQLKDDFYLKLATLTSVLDQPQVLSELLWQQRRLASHSSAWWEPHLSENRHALPAR